MMFAIKLRLSLHIVNLLVIAGVANQHESHGRVQVTLADGIVEGKQVKTICKGKTFYSFRGLPYAKPPLGDLRFAPPQPPEAWSTVLDATKPGNTCIQMYFPGRGSEDCLYLNVYTPALDKSLPVLVWLHGGSFVFIATNYSLSGADFFMEEEVILVTVNYRLGVFGFISTEDDVIAGNYGLKDQVAAISWVYDNIRAFGGDPNKITIMGQSAGGCSTSFLGMVPHLEGKIAGIIQQSGSGLMTPVLGRYHRVGAYVLSTRLGLQTQDSSAILEKLRQIDAETLRNKSLITYNDISHGIGRLHGGLYIPGLESRTNKDPLLTEMPYEQLRKGNFVKVPRMIGIVSSEAMYFTSMFTLNNKTYQNFDQLPRRFIPANMNTRNEHVGYLVKQHYSGDVPFVSNISNMVHYASDNQFVRPILKDASLVSKHVPTYLYEFTYEGKLGSPQERPLKGVIHGEEVAYLFYRKTEGKVSEKDQLVRRRLVRLWSNFAKYGNPTPIKDTLLGNKIWRKINPISKDVDYMNLGEELVPSLNPHHEDIQFWDDLYSKYGNPPYDTY